VSVIYDQCTGNVKKNRSSTAVTSMVIFTCPAGPVFRLNRRPDRKYCVRHPAASGGSNLWFRVG